MTDPFTLSVGPSGPESKGQKAPETLIGTGVTEVPIRISGAF
jgi:hypothetical protein